MSGGRARRRTRVVAAAVIGVLAVAAGLGVWGLARVAGRLDDVVPWSRAASEALSRLDTRAWTFAEAVQRVASGAEPTDEQLAAAAADSDLAVAGVDVTPANLSLWVVGVERDVDAHGDVWSCFHVTIALVTDGPDRPEVRRGEHNCEGTDVAGAVRFATRWLNERDVLRALGAGLVAAPTTAPAAGTTIDGLRIVASDVDGTTATVDVAGRAGALALGAPDAYVFGLRLVAGPDGVRTTPLRLPAQVDATIRERAEADASALVETSVPPSYRPMPWRANGQELVTLIRSDARPGVVVQHLVVEVVAGGWGARATDPAAPDVLVCYAWELHQPDRTASLHPEPCGYPLVLPAGP